LDRRATRISKDDSFSSTPLKPARSLEPGIAPKAVEAKPLSCGPSPIRDTAPTLGAHGRFVVGLPAIMMGK
jgi:hypothetical protein